MGVNAHTPIHHKHKFSKNTQKIITVSPFTSLPKLFDYTNC